MAGKTRHRGAPETTGPALAAASAPPEPDSPESLMAALRAGQTLARPLDLKNARLIGADLQGLDLTGVCLAGADLSKANLQEALLFKADLEGAVLFQANLEKAEMTGANLAGANLEGACLEQAGLGGATLTGAHLFGALLDQATLTGSSLEKADLRRAHMQGARLRNTCLVGADLSGACLVETELCEARVEQAIFNRADLRRAELSGLKGYARARWIHADIRDVNWLGARMVHRLIVDQNYLEEFRQKSRFSAWLYRLWWLTSDCGRSLVRWGICTGLVVLLFAWLYTLVDVDLGDHPTAFSSLYFSTVTMTTLGYGDVTPASAAAQVVAMIQVLLGYVALGGLLSIFSNKLARRGE